MDVFGDHAACCHHGPSLLFRHNNVRDILGYAARGAGLTAVVLEKKNQIAGSRAKPGDILFSNIIGALRAQLLTSLSLILCRKIFLKLRRGRLAWWHRTLTTR